MPRVYELPTHLEVEDQLIAGLTARQLLRLVIGASLAYGAWDQMPWLAQEVRLALAVVLAVFGAVFALLQPRGRPLDQWLLAAALFAVLPRQLIWQPGVTRQRRQRQDQTGWAELELHPEWLEAEPEHQPGPSAPVVDHRSAFWSLTHHGSPFASPGTRQQHLTDQRRLW